MCGWTRIWVDTDTERGSAMSKAGQADAVGGVFRVVAATYLAVHALRDQPVAGLELPNDVHTVRLDFETDDPTDDLKATMSDGRRCFISAKREVGNDRHLRDTVAGWVEQMGDIRGGDLLVLAAEELKGVVRDLAEALRRRRDGRDLASKHRSAIGAVIKYVPAALVEDLLDRVRVLHLRSATGASLTRTLLESMASYLVEDGNGGAVVSVLSDSFLTQAGDASASSIEDWVQAIRKGCRPLIASGSGPAGMRLAATLAAREAYNEILTARRGRIDLTLLAEDLPPVTVEDLIGGLRVETDPRKRNSDDKFLRVIRRWRRMLLVGQPGAGKSVALRELAAECAKDPRAPLPIHMNLTQLLRSNTEGLTVDSLLAAAAAPVTDLELREALVRHMRQELVNGTAILLCDGLDECGSRAAWMAQQLKDIVDGLNPRAGVVIAMRSNAAAAAKRLGLPRVDLVAPEDLSNTVGSVLDACADARIDEDQRGAWLAIRRQWISDARKMHSELFKVPLLAVLLALICADTPEADLPKGRALVLHAAIEQSVDRWETQRTSAVPRPWARELTAAMLLDGYVTLGRLLDSGAAPTRDEAVDELLSTFRDQDRWGLPPSTAREVADDVLRFWDEHVAVFVVNASNRLSSRSKVFAEIATAMWTVTATDDEIATWLTEVLPYTDSDGAIALAAGLNERVVECLLELSTTTIRSASTLLAELAVREIVALSADQITRLLEQVKKSVESAVAGKEETERAAREAGPQRSMMRNHPDAAQPGWKYVELACGLKLRPHHRQARAEIITAAALTAVNAATAEALCVLSDVESEGRALKERELEEIEFVIEQPLPPDGELINESRRRVTFSSWNPLGPGVARVALQAVKHLGALPETSARWVFEVSMKVPHGDSDEIRSALIGAGVDISEWWNAQWSSLSGLWRDDHNRYETMLLEDIASLGSASGESGGESQEDDLWSLTSIGDLLETTGYDTVSVKSFTRAFLRDNEATRRRWLDATADAYRVDKHQAARQAAWILQARTETIRKRSHFDENWSVMSMSSPNGRPLTEEGITSLSPNQQDALLDALEADSGWLAWSAANVLINVPTPTWDTLEMFEKDMSRWSMDRAALVYAVAIKSAGDKSAELFANAAESPAADYRIAARYSLSVNAELDEDGAVEERLQHDPDLTVRPSRNRKDEPPASYWTCLRCRRRNEMKTEDCPGCDDGSRPV